jgi:DNA-binding NarL/FixJ family response regulator
VVKRRRLNSARTGAAVCLLSANPLALPELERLTDRLRSRFSIKVKHIKLATNPLDVQVLKVPKATIYVVDAFSTGGMTESIVGAIRVNHPASRIIVLVPRIDRSKQFPLLQLGVKGLVAFPNVGRMLPRAITTIGGGGIWMPRTLISSFLDSVLPPQSRDQGAVTAYRLSRREREVLDCVLKNRSNKEIAQALHIAESTVKFHLAQLFQKFGVHRRADLILQSMQQPLL